MNELYNKILTIIENTIIPIGETNLKLYLILTRSQIHKIVSDITKQLPIENKTALEKGICPFPDDCDGRDSCTYNHCNADVCSNGYAYKMF